MGIDAPISEYFFGSCGLDINHREFPVEAGKNDSIIRSVVKMAESLGISTIAEGVETKEHADYLLSVGCPNMQGYYFGKAVPRIEFEKTFMNKKIAK